MGGESGFRWDRNITSDVRMERSVNSPIDLVNHTGMMLPQSVRWIEPTTGEIAGLLLDAAGLVDGARVLDVGAGTGPLVVAAAERGYEVAGVDNAPLTATYLKGRVAPYPRASADLADANALPYATDSLTRPSPSSP